MNLGKNLKFRSRSRSSLRYEVLRTPYIGPGLSRALISSITFILLKWEERRLLMYYFYSHDFNCNINININVENILSKQFQKNFYFRSFSVFRRKSNLNMVFLFYFNFFINVIQISSMRQISIWWVAGPLDYMLLRSDRLSNVLYFLT